MIVAVHPPFLAVVKKCLLTSSQCLPAPLPQFSPSCLRSARAMLPKALHAMALSQLLPPVIANFSGAYKKGQSLKSFCVFLLLFPRITYMVRKGFILLVAGSHHLYVSWFSLFLPTPFCILLALVATKTRQIICVLPACPFSGRDSGHEGPGALLWRRDVGKRASAKCEKTHPVYKHKQHHIPQSWIVVFSLFTRG